MCVCVCVCVCVCPYVQVYIGTIAYAECGGCNFQQVKSSCSPVQCSETLATNCTQSQALMLRLLTHTGVRVQSCPHYKKTFAFLWPIRLKGKFQKAIKSKAAHTHTPHIQFGMASAPPSSTQPAAGGGGGGLGPALAAAAAKAAAAAEQVDRKRSRSPPRYVLLSKLQ